LLTGKNILITGGAGFIGSHLCEYFLNKGNTITCLDNFITGNIENIQHLLSHKNFKLIEGDICDINICRNAIKYNEIVLHQAALGSVPRSVKDPLTTNQININGFLNVLQAAKDAGVKRFVYAASSSAYGDNHDLPKQEERIGKPLSPYAVTKYVNELYAKVYSDLYNMETIGLRYFNVFGKRQNPNGPYAAAIPKFIEQLKNLQSPEVFGDGTQTRDFTYIKNVIQANELAAATTNKSALNTVFNIAYGNNTSINELINTIKNILGKKNPAIKSIPIKYLSPRKGEVKHSLASIEKAQKLLDYKPVHNLEQGLTEMIE
jgi:UDP-N-acetylglucosamine 4-epimerase